jgi:hypothetical protein
MPPRLPILRIPRTLPRSIPRRQLSTAVPRHSSPVLPRLLVPTLFLSAGLYYLSHPTIAEEPQSSKTHPGRENRELTASASRKVAEQPGKAEKPGNTSGGSSHHHQPERAVAEEKPESGADEVSRTGKFRGGHDGKGQPRDEKLRDKSSGKGDKDAKSDDKKGKKGENKDKKEEKKDKKDEKKGTDDEGEEEEGPQAFGNSFYDVIDSRPRNW